MTKYFIDCVAIALSLILAFLFTDKPKVSDEPEPAVSREEEKTEASAEEESPVGFGPKEEHSYPAVEARNIFSPDGSYLLAAGKKPLPDNPYTLLGVIQGKAQRAVFREYSGTVVSVGQGDSLLDGSVVKSIERLSVTVERSGETKEHRIFDWRAKSDQSEGRVVPAPRPAPSSQGRK